MFRPPCPNIVACNVSPEAWAQDPFAYRGMGRGGVGKVGIELEYRKGESQILAQICQGGFQRGAQRMPALRISRALHPCGNAASHEFRLSVVRLVAPAQVIGLIPEPASDHWPKQGDFAFRGGGESSRDNPANGTEKLPDG